MPRSLVHGGLRMRWPGIWFGYLQTRNMPGQATAVLWTTSAVTRDHSTEIREHMHRLCTRAGRCAKAHHAGSRQARKSSITVNPARGSRLSGVMLACCWHPSVVQAVVKPV